MFLLENNDAPGHPYLSDPEMNWTSSFLLQSDKLVIVPHLLLAPVGTVVKPAEHEPGHRLSPSLEEVSRCSLQNRRSKPCTVDGRMVVWHVNPRARQDPGIQRDGLRVPPMNHAQVDVDPRRVEAHREEDPRKVKLVVSRNECTCHVLV